MRWPRPRRHAPTRARDVPISRATRRTARPSAATAPTASSTNSMEWVFPGCASHGSTRSRARQAAQRASQTAMRAHVLRVRSHRQTRLFMSRTISPPQRAHTHPKSTSSPALATNAS